MNSDPSHDSYRDPLGSVTTHVYDAQGQFLYTLGDDLPAAATYDYCGARGAPCPFTPSRRPRGRRPNRA